MAAGVLASACAPRALPATLPAPAVPAVTDAPLPVSWRLELEPSLDSLAGRIHGPAKTRIACDIGLEGGGDFRMPNPDRCRWLVGGRSPDFFAWISESEPHEVNLSIRNENPEGGAFAFWFTPRDPDQVTPILEQLLASHEWIRARLFDGRNPQGESPRSP